MREYNHGEIEGKWQKEWAEAGIYKTDDDSAKEKCYVLDMFPYPSGEGLHVGHPKGYIGTDIYARYKRMKGFSVLHPMGWDAFGLPAENYALKHKIHPRAAVEKNIARFKEQLGKIGFTYDWEREVNTSDPAFYKWTQWIFLQLFKKGLAYESHEPINWCPSCKTGLALEDLEGGKCERCGSDGEQKPLRQWVLKIREYADRLLSDLDALHWPESVKESQRNWIGRSEGANIRFKIYDLRFKNENEIEVFTTRPDTLFGATYLVLSPEHPLISNFKFQISNWGEVEEYSKQANRKTDLERAAHEKEKTGVELKGIKAINLATKEEIPVWIADYVLAHYGTGAIMAVPAHDERDFAFAKKFNLATKEVIVPNIIDKRNPPVSGKKTVERNNVHAIVKDPKTGKYLGLKWKKYDWLTFPMGGVEEGEDIVSAARREVEEETGYTNLKLVRVLDGRVRAEYFAKHKDENRIAQTRAVVFELVDYSQKEISSKEQEAHEIVWLPESKLNYENMTHAEVGHWNEKIQSSHGAYVGSGVLADSGKFSGLENEEAKWKIADEFGERRVDYKLRDWVFSRQRYWGEPIPLVFCEECKKRVEISDFRFQISDLKKDSKFKIQNYEFSFGEIVNPGWVAVPEDELPVKLPEVESYEPSGTGESPLANIHEWVETKCPKCGGKGKRETNTMPQWAGSSWYYIAYCISENLKSQIPISKQTQGAQIQNKIKHWLPVDLYVGGADHATRHLIYARFWHKVLFDLGFVAHVEPFLRLKNQGLIAGEDGRKMSKRWGNVVNPDDVIAQFGADTLRVYEMFMGPFEDAIVWSTDAIVGPRRFLERVWRLREKIQHTTYNIQHTKIERLLHKTIKKVSDDIEQLKFNTAISALMILVNEIEKEEAITEDIYKTLLLLLSPFAPHITEELWHDRGGEGFICNASWPRYEEEKTKGGTVRIVVQVNGRVRDTFEAIPDASEEAIKKEAQTREAVTKFMEGKEVLKVVYVPGKLVNIVTG